MRAVRPARHPKGGHGFTLVEAMVALAVFAILLAVGVPRMADWLAATRAAAATGFYAEGMAVARSQALAHNGASRLVLSRNAGNGQYDWRVDVCFPNPEAPCSDSTGAWSTAADAVKPVQDAGAGVKSIVRSAEALPGTGRLSVTPGPDGATAVYFTQLGWVDTRVDPRMMRIDLAPGSGAGSDFQAASVVLTLGGIAARCAPGAPANDSRRCPE